MIVRYSIQADSGSCFAGWGHG